MRPALATLIALATTATVSAPLAAATDDMLRLRQLENEVMRLQREIDAQARRIDSLERTARSATPGAPTAAPSRPADNSPAWLVNANWDRLRTGMKELEVIALLGRPTSVRTESDGKVHSLLYALELGPDAILAGSVRMGDAGVAEINRPVLR